MLQIFRKMSSTNKKIALAKKVAENRLKKLQKTELPDIEDIGVKSPYFSPVQTRRQRADNKNAVKVLKMQATKKLDFSKQEQLQGEIMQKLDFSKLEQPTTSKRVNKKHGIKILQPTAADETVTPKKQKLTKVDTENKASANDGAERKDTWMPKDWALVLENIRAMRAQSVAPVDTMGCHKCADGEADEKTQRFQKLVALMLSSQTKDETTYEAMKRLKEAKLTPANILAMPVVELERLLHPVSFYKNKAKYLQQTARILIDKYDADIPDNVKELVALPGVGPKMAHICMSTAWNKVTGIGVDVHVHRIANRLRWLPKPTKEPEQTRQALERWLPQPLWSDVNYLLVGFGQTVCTPVRPHCGNCLNRDVCPSVEKARL